jgi:hypothetical protein
MGQIALGFGLDGYHRNLGRRHGATGGAMRRLLVRIGEVHSS